MLAVLRTICTYAAGNRYLYANPFALRKTWIRAPRPKDDKKRHHSIEDIARVLELGRSTIARKVPGSMAWFRAWRTYAAAATTAYTGMRKVEVLRLWIEDVDLARRSINIVERQGNVFKTAGSAVPVAMPDALAAILAEYIDALAAYKVGTEPMLAHAPESNPTGERQLMWLFPNAYRTNWWSGGSPGHRAIDALKRLGQRAGVDGFTFLSLRHSWASHAESAWGFSEGVIKRQMRHTTTKTQKLYRHNDPANMRQAIQGVTFGEQTPSAAVPPAAVTPAIEFTPPAPVRADVPKSYRGPKLDDDDVVEARELRSRNWTYSQLMKRYNVSKSTLYAMLTGLTHKHVPPAEGA